MSQPSDLDFGDGGFTETLESTYEEPTAAAAPIKPVVRYRPQGFSIYTIMLILSFISLLAGMIIMLVEAGKYQ